MHTSASRKLLAFANLPRSIVYYIKDRFVYFKVEPHAKPKPETSEFTTFP